MTLLAIYAVPYSVKLKIVQIHSILAHSFHYLYYPLSPESGHALFYILQIRLLAVTDKRTQNTSDWR